jgi:predicted RecA/RadA family phage recombinase
MGVDKINGIAVVSIAKINGKTVDSYTKINGVTISSTPAVHSPMWVAVGGNKLAYSTDAIPTGSWTEVSTAGVFSFKDLTFGKNASGTDTWYGCSTSDSKAVGYSTDPTDAASWTVVNPPGTGGGTAIEYGATETLIMGREHENYTIRRSTDYALNWVDSTIHNANNSKATDSLATDGDGIWLAGMGSLGVILKSYDDGINWYKSADLGNDKHIGLEYANGVWVATEEGETINICTDVGADTSTDTWTAINPPVWNRAADPITHVTGSTWMIGAARRNIYKSTDNAASWTDVTKLDNPGGGQTNNNPYSMASDGTSVVVVGKNGFINVSTDLGVSWTIPHTMSANQSLVAVEYNKVKPF